MPYCSYHEVLEDKDQGTETCKGTIAAVCLVNTQTVVIGIVLVRFVTSTCNSKLGYICACGTRELMTPRLILE